LQDKILPNSAAHGKDHDDDDDEENDGEIAVAAVAAVVVAETCCFKAFCTALPAQSFIPAAVETSLS
jgi:hypothetical protein